ncbi:hypothetical protein VTO73DRAFT_6524 [Trametes versicolor]
MRTPRTLLLLLASAALVAAEDSPECKDGLDKLKNKSGQSPCTVYKQVMKACDANSSNVGQCKCNTITYNVWAACAACAGDAPPDWANYADNQSCGSDPEQPSSSMDVAHGTIPQWAYLPLTPGNEFNMTAAILTANDATDNLTASSTGSSRPNVAVQVGVPIAAGVGVAIIVTTVFWLYWRRKTARHNPRMKTLPLIPGAQSTFWRPWRWFYTFWPWARSARLRPSKKNSNWAIDVDEDEEWLGHARAHSSASYVDPYKMQPLSPEPLEMDVPHTSAHIQETSSSSLLPHLDFPDVRVPTFIERFIKSKDGVRKSPAYKSKYVSPISPDPQFRIDGPTPTANTFPASKPQRSSYTRSNHSGASASATAQPPRTQPVVAERSDFQPESEGVGSSVLIISRDGNDFSFDDSATTAPSHSHASSPRTPTTFRQASTAYSGSRTNTGTDTGTGSWLPSPNRANTSSTLSGAYPTELRRDPELTQPRTWAARFPAPPQPFSTSPTAFHSFAEQMEQLPERAREP